MKIAALLFVVGVNLTLLLADGLVVVVGLLVTLLLSGGLGFTLHEFKRLSAKSEICDRAAGKTLDSRPADFKGTSGNFPLRRDSQNLPFTDKTKPRRGVTAAEAHAAAMRVVQAER